MAGNKLEVVIDGDIRPLTQELKNAENKISDFSKKGVGQATASMNDLSRVVQDLPYGFIGIQNNLNPLLESFGRLKAETGSGKAALLALGRSLIGSGGLGIALAGVSTAFLLYQKYASGAAKETKKASDEVKTLVSSLAQEASRVSVLVNALQTENLSRRQKLSAIEELRRINPNYFGQLKDEEGLVNKLSGVYNAYSQSLVKAAQNKAFAAKVEALFSKKLELELAVDPDSPNNIISVSRGVGADAADAFRKAYNINPTDSLSFTTDKPVWNQYGALAGKEIKKGAITAQPFFDKKVVNKELSQIDAELQYFLKKMQDTGQTKFNPFDEKNGKRGASKSLEQIFYDINEAAGAGWQKLIDASEKWRDQYYDAWAQQVSESSKKQKVIDAFNRTNEDIRKGIVGFQAGGSVDPFGGMDIKNMERLAQLQGMLRQSGQTPRDTSYLTDEGAQLQLLNEQWAQYQERLGITGAIVNDFVAPAFTGLFDNLLSGTQTAGQALSQFFTGLIKKMVATVAQAAALAAVMQAFGLGGGASFGQLFKSNLGIPSGAGVGSAGDAFGGISISGTLRGRDIALAGQMGAASLGRIGYG